mgnify:CR=1 FL=1
MYSLIPILIVFLYIAYAARALRKRVDHLHHLVDQKLKDCNIQDFDFFSTPKTRGLFSLKVDLERLHQKIKKLLKNKGEVYLHFNWKHSSLAQKLNHLEDAFSKLD